MGCPFAYISCVFLKNVAKEFKVNHLLFVDGLNVFGKNDDQIDSLMRTVQLLSEDIGMEIGLKKCCVLVMERGKTVKFEGVTLPNGHLIREIDLGIIEVDIQEKKMKKQSARRMEVGD